jgi:hypothetical protein
MGRSNRYGGLKKSPRDEDKAPDQENEDEKEPETRQPLGLTMEVRDASVAQAGLPLSRFSHFSRT